MWGGRAPQTEKERESRGEVNAGRKRSKEVEAGERCAGSFRSDQSFCVFVFFNFPSSPSPSSSRAEQATMTKRADGGGN